MFKYVLAFGLSMTAVSAYAFHLDDHERVMRQAVGEFISCHPEFAETLNSDWLVKGDRDEDLDFVTKELYFSHFYHPGKNLQFMWRKDSAARLVNLQPSLLQCRRDREHITYNETVNLGHAIHHLQDMAVPSHVVPVMHSFWDGFETFAVAGDIDSGWDCSTLDRSALELEKILNETAQDTLNSVRDFKFDLKRADGTVIPKTGSSLWLEGEGDAFGSYGELGNNFGEGAVPLGDDYYAVDVKVFSDYKREQLRAAVRASLRALSYQLVQAVPAS